MHVFITGASGLAGNAIARAALDRGFQVTLQSHRRDVQVGGSKVRHVALDLHNPENVDGHILHGFPDVIINAAAVSEPHQADANPQGAEKLNVALPRRLAQLANHLSARIIHLSSDMVFDGTDAPYASSAVPNPRSLYGQLKLLSEREVLKFGGDFAIVLRIPLLTGNSPSGARSVHEKLFHDWAEGKTAKLFTHEIRQPLGVDSLAEAVVEVCERPSLRGIFHWAGAEALSRYAMGLHIVRHFGLPEKLVQAVEAVDDKRPRDLRLDLAPLQPKLKARPADFATQLAAMQPPPLCLAWYESICRTASGATALAPQRLVRGRDF